MTPPSGDNENGLGGLSDRELLIRIHERVKVLPDHESRIRRLERWAWTLGGAWIIISAWLKAHIMGGGK